MFARLREPVEVKLVGQDWIIGLVGPTLLAIAAIVAASLAAYVASRNHREQLDHDRALRERDHTRNVLDAAIEDVMATVERLSALSVATEAMEKKRDKYDATLQDDDADPDSKADARSGLTEISKTLSARSKETATKILEMHVGNGRLKLRFGVLGDIPVAHDELGDACRKYLKTLSLAASKNRTEEQEKETGEADTECTEAFATLMVLCEEWFAGTVAS